MAELKYSLSELTHPDAVIVERGGKKFALTSEGIKNFETTKLVTGKEAKEIFEDILHNVAEGKEALPKDVAAKIKTSINNVSGHVPAEEVFAGLRTRADVVLNTAAGVSATTTAEELAVIAKDNPRALDLLTEAQETALKDAKHDLTAVRKAGTEARAAAEALGKLNGEFLEVAKSGDAKKMAEFVSKNGDKFHQLEIDAATQGQYPLLGTIKAKVAEVKPLIEEKEALQRTLKLGTAEEITTATKRIGEIDKAIDGKFTGELKNIRKVVDSHFTANSVVAEAGKGGKWYSLMKGETALLETAAKKGVAVSELSFLNKVRPGKTAAVVGGAVVAAYMAGVGGKGKHTEQVASQQLNNEQSIGVA